jgi:hypothetical protein
MKPRLKVRWISWHRAKAYIAKHHRHHQPPRGFIVCLGCWDDAGMLRGVATLARPSARMLDNGDVLEITRVATDGCDNASSALYGACRRVGQALGFERTITYTLPEESGASLRGAGFTLKGEAGGGSWSRASRPREDKAPQQAKLLWEA